MSAATGRFTILHLSDIHATAGDLLYGQIDGLERIRQVAAYARSAGITPEAVVVTGDLIQRGHAAAYPAVDEALRLLGEAVGAPVLTVLGNHDDDDAARRLAGHVQSHYRVEHIGELRFILLDSSTGSLDRAQLTWLRGVLSRPYGLGTVVALHHAPVPSPMPTLSKTGLRNPEEFAAALAGSGVRIILAGHYHHPMFGSFISGSFDAIPVSVGPSLAYHQVMNAGPDTVSGHDLAMFSLLHATGSSITAVPVSLLAARPLFSVPAPSLSVPSNP